MDPILQVLLSWQFILFSLAVAAAISIIRTIIEYIFSVRKRNLKRSKLWNDLILPLLPVGLGICGGIYLKHYPYPGFTPGSDGLILRSDRIIFGLVAGLLSTLLYRIIKTLAYQKSEVIEVVHISDLEVKSSNDPLI
jgi:hypothetical protein